MFVLLCVCYVVLLCFRLVFLSFCLNTTQYTTLNTNKFEMCLFMTCVKCSKQCSSSFQITLLSLQISKSFVLYKTNSKRCISPRREPLFSLECASRLGESLFLLSRLYNIKVNSKRCISPRRQLFCVFVALQIKKVCVCIEVDLNSCFWPRREHFF